jgi:hypothetical protein
MSTVPGTYNFQPDRQNRSSTVPISTIPVCQFKFKTAAGITTAWRRVFKHPDTVSRVGPLEIVRNQRL